MCDYWSLSGFINCIVIVNKTASSYRSSPGDLPSWRSWAFHPKGLFSKVHSFTCLFIKWVSPRTEPRFVFLSEEVNGCHEYHRPIVTNQMIPEIIAPKACAHSLESFWSIFPIFLSLTSGAMDLFTLYVLFSHYRPRDGTSENCFF